MDNFSISNLDFNETHLEDKNAVSNDFSKTLGALILSLVFLLGVPGNFFIVWSILARIRQRSVTTLLILNLACADGLLMALTIFFIVYLAKRTWVFGNIMCKSLFYLCNANMYASIFLITLMSVYRMVVLVLSKEISSIVTRKFMKRTIIGMWVLVMMISTPSAVFREVIKINNTILVCTPNHTLASHVSRLLVCKYKRFFFFFLIQKYIVNKIRIQSWILWSIQVFVLKQRKRTRFKSSSSLAKKLYLIICSWGRYQQPLWLWLGSRWSSQTYFTCHPRGFLNSIWLVPIQAKTMVLCLDGHRWEL